MAKALNGTSDIWLLPDLRHDDLFLDGDNCNLSPPELHSSNGESVSTLSRRVARSFLNKDEDFNSLLIKRKQNSFVSSKPAGEEFYQNRSFTEQKHEFAQFHDLELQQLMKNQLSTARRTQSIAKVSRPLGFSSSPASPPVLQSQPSAGMHVVFLNPRKESSGTGVFLPRQPGSPNEPRKQQACSTALLPARVVQALNLNQDDLCFYPRAPSHGELLQLFTFVFFFLRGLTFSYVFDLFQEWVLPETKIAVAAETSQRGQPAPPIGCRRSGPTDISHSIY